MITDPSVPSAARYKEALESIEQQITANQRKMLVLLYHAPNRSLRASEMAPELGYTSFGPINSQFGMLGHRLSDILNWTPSNATTVKYRWWAVLANGENLQNGGFLWTLRPEVATALEELGWVS